jgi:predicted N-acyltransferase
VIKYNEEIAQDDWASFLKDAKGVTPFHTRDYYIFLQNLKGVRPVAMGFYVEGTLASLAILTYYHSTSLLGRLSSRMILYGGLAFKERDSIQPIIEEIESRFRRNIVYLEIRYYQETTTFSKAFDSFEYLPYLNVNLSISSFDNMENYLASLKYNVRREIKKGLSYGLTYERSFSESDLEKFYSILQDLYRDRVRLPLPKFDFFRELLHSGNCAFFVVKYQGEVVAGAVTLYKRGTSINTWYYAGERMLFKSVYPTHIAILAVIDFALQHRIPLVDFMGAGLRDEDYGVRNYKLKFGGELLESGRHIKVYKPIRYYIAKRLLKYLRALI